MEVWSFQTGIDYTEFHFLDEDVRMGILDLLDKALEEFKPIGKEWETPLMLRGEPKKKADIFEIENTGIIALSEFAKKNLEEFIDNTEFLPIETDAGLYYAVNLLEPLDCLDIESSDFSATDNGKIISYNYLDFKKENLADSFIYRIPQFKYATFLTLNFHLKYLKSDLRGLVFDENTNLLWRS